MISHIRRPRMTVISGQCPEKNIERANLKHDILMIMYVYTKNRKDKTNTNPIQIKNE